MERWAKWPGPGRWFITLQSNLPIPSPGLEDGLLQGGFRSPHCDGLPCSTVGAPHFGASADHCRSCAGRPEQHATLRCGHHVVGQHGYGRALGGERLHRSLCLERAEARLAPTLCRPPRLHGTLERHLRASGGWPRRVGAAHGSHAPGARSSSGDGRTAPGKAGQAGVLPPQRPVHGSLLRHRGDPRSGGLWRRHGAGREPAP
jgi:hypothetical protein